MTVPKMLALLACAACSAAAVAQEGPFYVGGSIGLAYVDGTAQTDEGVVTDADGLPEEVPLDGAPFDDDDGSWSAFAGYQINRYVGVELGYTDLGSFTTVAGGVGSSEPGLEAESVHLTARFRYPLGHAVFATWHLGLNETSFDAQGAVRVGRISGPIFGPIVSFTEVPVSDVDDETGYHWGFGFHWQFSERLGSALDFTRHDVRVFEIDTVNLRLVVDL